MTELTFVSELMISTRIKVLVHPTIKMVIFMFAIFESHCDCDVTYGIIFQIIFKRNCKLYLQLRFQFVDAYVET